MGGFFWEEFFWEDFWEEFNKKLFEYGRNLFVCKDFGFCQDFGLRKGRRKFKSLEVRLQKNSGVLKKNSGVQDLKFF